MRTRLASLIIVKQEPLSNDYVDGENETINYDDVGPHHLLFGHQQRLELLQNIGEFDSNNNNNNNNNNSSINNNNNNNNNNNFNKEELEGIKCMYFVYSYYFLSIYFIS